MKPLTHIQKTKVHWPLKLAAICVYLFFFTVQLFFNVDTNPHLLSTEKISLSLSSKRTDVSEHAVIKRITAHSSSRVKLRLNRRFEPSYFPVPVVSVVEIVTAHREPVIRNHYINPVYTDVFVTTYSLRGPPSIVA